MLNWHDLLQEEVIDICLHYAIATDTHYTSKPSWLEANSTMRGFIVYFSKNSLYLYNDFTATATFSTSLTCKP